MSDLSDMPASSTGSVAEDLPRGLRVVSSVLATIAGTAIIGLMLITVVDIYLRERGRPGVAGIIEWTEVLLVAVVVAGLMTAEINRVHVRTDVLTSRLRPFARHLVRGIGLAVVTGFALWFVYATWTTAQASYELREVRPGIAEVPIWPAKLAIPVGFLGLGTILGIRAVLDLREAWLLRPGQHDRSSTEGTGAEHVG